MAKQQANRWIEARARQRCQKGKEAKSENQDVCYMRETDAGKPQRRVKAYIAAATEEIGIVHQEDERCEPDTLTKLLQHPAFPKRGRF